MEKNYYLPNRVLLSNLAKKSLLFLDFIVFFQDLIVLPNSKRKEASTLLLAKAHGYIGFLFTSGTFASGAT